MKTRGSRVGMRWWLALAFAAIAAVTAVAVVRVTTERSEDAFRRHSEEFAVGNSFGAALALGRAEPTRVAATADRLAQARKISVFLFDRGGSPLTEGVSRGVRFDDVPDARDALAAALEGRRHVSASADGSVIVVGIPFVANGASALVTYSARPVLREQLGIVRAETAEAALWATLVGAAVGFLLATFIARRLGRIAAAAGAIEAGDFSQPLDDSFPDEVGSLSQSLDRMRIRLRDLVVTLREDRDRFEGLVERLNEGVVLLSHELDIQYANRGTAEVAGVDGIRVGAPLGDIFDSEPLLRFASRLAGGEPLEPEYVELGHRTLCLSGVASAPNRDGAVLVLSDVTQRERAERAQREFVTNAAHELRTPVAAIVTAVEMLQTGAKDVPHDRDVFIEHVEREAQRLARLTRALLVLARAEADLETPKADDVALAPILHRVASELDAKSDVEVSVDCPADLSVSTDQELLEQALHSVVGNAGKYTATGTISLRGHRLADNRVAVQVVDSGRGIAGIERNRLFERFYRGSGDKNGFGLGLAIAAQSVRVVGGSIDVRPNAHEGTTVELILPAQAHKR